MRYQDLRRPRGAGELWLRLRLRFAAPGIRRASTGRLDSLSRHELKDIGLDSCGNDGDPVPFWRLDR